MFATARITRSAARADAAGSAPRIGTSAVRPARSLKYSAMGGGGGSDVGSSSDWSAAATRCWSLVRGRASKYSSTRCRARCSVAPSRLPPGIASHGTVTEALPPVAASPATTRSFTAAANGSRRAMSHMQARVSAAVAGTRRRPGAAAAGGGEPPTSVTCTVIAHAPTSAGSTPASRALIVPVNSCTNTDADSHNGSLGASTIREQESPRFESCY